MKESLRLVCCTWANILKPAKLRNSMELMFLYGTDSSQWMFSSQLRLRGKNILSPRKQGLNLVLCIKIRSYVQNFAKLVQESWLTLSKLTKAILEYYINTCIPSEGENAACGCMARSCFLSADGCNFPSSDLHFAPSWMTTEHFPPAGKVLWYYGLLSSPCWETVHRAISIEQ